MMGGSLTAVCVCNVLDGGKSGDDEYRMLMTYALRTEGGGPTDFWDNESSLQLMYRFSKARLPIKIDRQTQTDTQDIHRA